MHCITDEERDQIAALRRACAKELAAVPNKASDLTHDFTIARFLRGHPSEEAAAAALAASLVYRSQLRANKAYQSLWETCLAADEMDYSILPHASTVLQFLPLRILQGTSVLGTPIGCSVSKLIDLPGFDGVDEAQADAFLSCMVELDKCGATSRFWQRLLVLLVAPRAPPRAPPRRRLFNIRSEQARSSLYKTYGISL